jgi:hypothetical protein
MLEGGEWRATAVSADPSTIGFHLSAIYSPVGWLSWERIARGWEAAQGSDETIRAFRNTILGESSDKVKPRRGGSAEVPPADACGNPRLYQRIHCR